MWHRSLVILAALVLLTQGNAGAQVSSVQCGPVNPCADTFGTLSSSGSSTNNAIARWDGTSATTLQDSNCIVTDPGVISCADQNPFDAANLVSVQDNCGFSASCASDCGGDGFCLVDVDPACGALRVQVCQGATDLKGIILPDAGGLGFGDNQIMVGTANHVTSFVSMPPVCLTIANPVDASDPVWFKAPAAMTVNGINCVIVGGTSVAVDVQECTATDPTTCATLDAAVTCDTNGATDDGAFSNPTIDAGDWVRVFTGAPSGSVTQVTVCLSYY